LGLFDVSRFAKELAVKHADHVFIAIPAVVVLIVGVITAFLAPSAALPVALFAGFILLLVVLLHGYRQTQRDIQHTQRQIQSLMALYHLNDFRNPIPALGGWTATPELLVSIMNVVHQGKARHVVELGSGASTSIIPYFFDGGGQLTSIEHEGAFLEKTRIQIAGHHADRVKLHHGALVNQQVNGENWRWYDISGLSFDHPIDVLIVDGPPLKTQFMARYPALPVLYPFLADQAVILVDDADRPDEQAMLARWQREFPGIRVEMDFSQKGLARVYVDKSRG